MEKNFNVLLILSGGTICTSVQDIDGKPTRLISKDTDVLLAKNFYNSTSEFANQVNIETSENFGILSENMTIGKWNQLISYLRTKKDLEKYDGIVIAHGTDTLAYSASLFSLVLKKLEKPVFLVSSNMPLTSDDANGNDNFRTAIELICCGINPNVYVTYKNPDDNNMYLHLGARLLQCKSYDENFYSKGAVLVPNTIKKEYIEQLSIMLPQVSSTVFDDKISFFNEWVLSNCVLKIEPYVGLDYSSYNYDTYKAVLHGTYHSGTVCENSTEYIKSKTSDSILSLIDKPNRGYDVYISPSNLEGEIYDTVLNVLKFSDNFLGVEFLSGLTSEMMYVKLLIAYSIEGFEASEILKFIKTDICGEITYC